MKCYDTRVFAGFNSKGATSVRVHGGFMHLSIAIWIVNYPIVMPFAASGQVGKIWGEGGGGASSVRQWHNDVW